MYKLIIFEKVAINILVKDSEILCRAVQIPEMISHQEIPGLVVFRSPYVI